MVGATIRTTQERVYAFVEARNAGAEQRAVRIYFDGPGGRRVGNVTLEVPGTQRRFRTWGYTRYIDTPGTSSLNADVSQRTLALLVPDDGVPRVDAVVFLRDLTEAQARRL